MTAGTPCCTSLAEEDSLSDEEVEDDIVAAVAESLAIREEYYCRERIIWSSHVQELRRAKSFAANYRMSEESFIHLLSKLRPGLHVDEYMSTLRTGEAPISAEVVLHCTLRWLAGGSYLDICNIGHIHRASFYRCLYKGIKAILNCRELAIRLPRGRFAIERAAQEFASCSDGNLFDGCVGCIDGMLVELT